MKNKLCFILITLFLVFASCADDKFESLDSVGSDNLETEAIDKERAELEGEMLLSRAATTKEYVDVVFQNTTTRAAAIQTAINLCSKNGAAAVAAGQKIEWWVRIPKGTHQLEKTLYFKNYANIDAQGSTLVRNHNGYMIRNITNTELGNLPAGKNIAYPGASNFSFVNATLDMNKAKNAISCISIGYAQHLVFDKIKVINCKDNGTSATHSFDLIACDDVLIKHCTFTSKTATATYGEAIQIDADQPGAAGWISNGNRKAPFSFRGTSNVTVTNCYFAGGWQVAVGAHSGNGSSSGKYNTSTKFYKNISVVYNYIDGMSLSAVRGCFADGWIVKHNYIINCEQYAISFYNKMDSHSPSKNLKIGNNRIRYQKSGFGIRITANTKYAATNKHSNIHIFSNMITYHTPTVAIRADHVSEIHGHNYATAGRTLVTSRISYPTGKKLVLKTGDFDNKASTTTKSVTAGASNEKKFDAMTSMKWK